MYTMLRGKHSNAIAAIIFLSFIWYSSYGQMTVPGTTAGWDGIIKTAMKSNDTGQVKNIMRLTGIVLTQYFNGKKPAALAVVVRLINTAEQLSKQLGYESGFYQSMLLRRRLLNIEGKDSLANVLHDKAMRYYAAAGGYQVAEAFYFLSGSWQYRIHAKSIIATDSAYYLRARNYYHDAGDKIKEISVQRAVAYIHILTGQLNSAISELRGIYQLQLQLNDSTRHKTSDFLAHSYAVTGRFTEGLACAFQSLQFASAIGDTIDMALYHHRIGRIKYNLGEMDEGTVYLKKSLDEFEVQKDTSLAIHTAFVICNEGMIRAGRYREALRYGLEIVKKYPEGTSDDYALNRDVALGLATCYFHMKQYQQAEDYYLKAYDIVEKQRNRPEDKIPVYFDLGVLYLQQKNIEKAEAFFYKTLVLSELTNSLPAIRDVQLQLFTVDSLKGDYLKAIGHYKIYKAVTDSMFNEGKSKQLSELEIQYKTQQREKDVQLLTNQGRLQQTTIRQAESLRNAMIAGAVFLLILLLLVFNSWLTKQRSNTQLQAKQQKINQQNRALEQMVIEEKKLATDKDKLLQEKEWLLKEIHHRVKNNLQIVMSLLNSQSAYLKDDVTVKAIKETQNRVHTISLIHQKFYQSENLSVINMAEYIKEVVEYLVENSDSHGRITIHTGIDPICLDMVQAVPLGLIINEALTNAVKYAFPDNKPGTVSIKMVSLRAGRIALTVKDDGIGLPGGFDWMNAQSLGMSLMQGLCKQLDGFFEITSGYGLTVKVLFSPAVLKGAV